MSPLYTKLLLTQLLTWLLTWLSTWLSTQLLTWLLTQLLTWLPELDTLIQYNITWLLTWLLTQLLTWLLTWLSTQLLTWLSTWTHQPPYNNNTIIQYMTKIQNNKKYWVQQNLHTLPSQLTLALECTNTHDYKTALQTSNQLSTYQKHKNNSETKLHRSRQ